MASPLSVTRIRNTAERCTTKLRIRWRDRSCARNFAVLRFNFRGTEGSDGVYDNGVGELDDALAAMAWMRQQ